MRSAFGIPLAILLLATTWASAQAPAGADARVDAPLARGSISIDGDAGFADPLNGVRGVQGTAADPYRISGYTLLHDRGAALRLNGTSAHVLIEDIHVPRQAADVGTARDCALSAAVLCDVGRGIDLVDARNVTVRSVRIDYEPFGVRLVRAQDVTLDTVRIGETGGSPVLPLVGVLAFDSSRLTLRSVVVHGAAFPVQATNITDLLVESSRFDSDGNDGHRFHLRSPLDRITIRDSTFVDVGLRFETTVHNLTVHRNVFSGPQGSIGDGFGLAYDTDVCGNTVQGSRALGAVAFLTGANLTVRDNRLENNTKGADLGRFKGLVFQDNLVANSTREGLWSLASPALVTGNHFSGNVRGHWIPLNGTDARGNWWGAADGPSGIGPGSGESIRTLAGTVVDVSGWLHAPPALDFACGTPGPAAQEPVAGPLRVKVHADAWLVAGPVRWSLVHDTDVVVLP